MSGRGAVAAVVVLLGLVLSAPAQAAIPDSLKRSCDRRDAADADTSNGFAMPFWLCDDGTPDSGGTSPNPGAAKAVAVPQRYGGDGFTGLPPKAPADGGTGADSNGDIALDVDLSLPDPERFPVPGEGYPLVVMMHGCCGGNRRSWENPTAEGRGTTEGSEKWHYNNAWFASRGYVVLTYTARGFVDSQNHGSTGQTQLDSRRYEINDYQHLAGQIADTTFTVAGRTVRIDPSRVVATGGSYGGGFSWLAFTDPTWTSPGGRAMRLVAAAPKYGWTNLVESLVPSGADLRDRLAETDPAKAGSTLGMPKRSIVAGLYATGRAPNGNHTTFPPSVDRDIACLNSPFPLEASPQCTDTLRTTLPEFLNDRSAYFQNAFFDRIRTDRSARVAVFSAGTFTDPLFPPSEHRRMVERLRSVVPDYPVQETYGDYQHFTQNKEKEWSDVCGADRHPCRASEYGSDLAGTPSGLRRLGITNRLNRFLDHYARPPADQSRRRPAFDVTAAIQTCPINASSAFPLDEPGERYTESSFGELAPDRLRLSASGARTTTSDAEPNPHATSADPVANQLGNGNRCIVDSSSAGPGVAVYDFPALASDVVMIGQTRVTVPHTGSGSDLQLNARLYEVFGDGRQVLVDRGVKRVGSANETTVFDLRGNGWRFQRGNRIRIELAQDDDPHVKQSTVPSSLSLAGVTLELPVRYAGPDAIIRAPLLASSAGTRAVLPFELASRSGEAFGLAGSEAEVADTRSHAYRRLAAGASSFRGRAGRTYRLRGRVLDRRGVPGAFAETLAVFPLDDRARALRYRGRWRRVRSSRAYGRRLRRTTRRGSSVSLRFRGDRVYLIGRRSRRGGRALVTLNGRRRVVSFRSRRTFNRSVLAMLRARRRGSNRLRLVALRGRVELDAVGIRRP